MSFTPTFSNGYTCLTCGQWVPTGAPHSCGTTTWIQPQIQPNLDWNLLAELQKITALLEKLVKLSTPITIADIEPPQ